MAFVTGTATGNNLTRIAWSSKLHRETQNRFFFEQRGMVAPDVGDEPTFERRGGAPIRSQEALNGKRAQEVRVGLRLQLTTNRSISGSTRTLDAQTYGTASMIDNEETMALSDFTAWVEQMKHATSFDVPEIQDLRTEFKMTVQAADALTDWMAAEKEEAVLDAIYNQHSAHVVAGISSVSAANPPSNNQQYANAVADSATLATADRLDSAELRRMFAWFDINNINPISYKGQDCAVLLCHTHNYNDLNADTTFRSAFEQAWDRGTGNPLFDMADCKFMNIYIHKYNRIRNAASGANAANVRRCVLLGADAIAEGVTARPRLVRRKEDKYEDIFGLAIKAINGWARADFAPVSGTTLNQGLAIWDIYTNSSI
tara:strand:- start:21 stop:1136 length:1116 start_codon:yes stop_codon:yes gene_type:complete